MKRLHTHQPGAASWRRGGITAWRVLLLTTVLAGLTWMVWKRDYSAPVIAALRDFKYEIRVRDHAEVLRVAAQESGLDPYLLAGIMIAESSGDVDAVSSAGALGLFQLAPVTASWRAEKLGLEKPSREELLSDALLNARLGADNMAWLLDTYDGDVVRALCAYNCGARKLRRLSEAAGGWEEWRDQRERTGKSQLLAYAQKVLRYRDGFRVRDLLESKNE